MKLKRHTFDLVIVFVMIVWVGFAVLDYRKSGGWKELPVGDHSTILRYNSSDGTPPGALWERVSPVAPLESASQEGNAVKITGGAGGSTLGRGFASLTPPLPSPEPGSVTIGRPEGGSYSTSNGTTKVWKPVEGDIVFMTPTHEHLRFKPDGTILLRGKEVANDLELVQAVRAFFIRGTAECKGKVTEFDHEKHPVHDLKFLSGSPGKGGDGGAVIIHGGEK